MNMHDIDLHSPSVRCLKTGIIDGSMIYDLKKRVEVLKSWIKNLETELEYTEYILKGKEAKENVRSANK